MSFVLKDEKISAPSMAAYGLCYRLGLLNWYLLVQSTVDELQTVLARYITKGWGIVPEEGS